MTYNNQLTSIPQCVWTLIAHFADVDDRQPQNAREVADLGRGEGNRRFASTVGSIIQQTSSQFGSTILSKLRSRVETRAYLGDFHHDVMQRGSIMEAYSVTSSDQAQYFPMSFGLVDGDGDFQTIVVDLRTFSDEFLIESLASSTTMIHGQEVSLPSPFTYRYLVREVGLEEAVESSAPDVREAVMSRRRFMVYLKAYMFLLILSGNIPEASAQPSSVEDYGLNKYWMLLLLVLESWMKLWVSIMGAISIAISCVNLDWYYRLPLEFQAGLDLVLLYAVYRVLRMLYEKRTEEPALIVTAQPGRDVYLGQVATEKGVYHNVRVEGKNLRLPTMLEAGICHQDEMAMPGSDYFPCKAQAVGAILVCTESTDLRLFGVFWRMDEYIVTARHCSNTLNQSTATVYLATIRQTKKGNWEVDRTNLYKTHDQFWSPEGNAIAAYDIDAFASALTEKEWSCIRVTKASTKVKSSYNQQVHSIGFTTDGLLVSASGKTLPDSGFEHLHHTASTQKGFSGSVILCGNSVVGMHVSAAGEHNVAVRTEMIQYLIDVGTGLESNSKNQKKYTYADASYKEHFRQHKWRGGVVDIKVMRDGKYSVVLRDGEATYGWSMNELIDAFGTGNAAKDEDVFEDMLAGASFASKYGSRADRYVDYDDDRYHKNTFENASIAPSSTRQKRSRKKAVSKPPAARVETMDWLYKVTTGLKPVHGPSAPKQQPDAVQLIENHKEELVELGYVEGEFVHPMMTPQEEKLSLVKHLEIFGKASKSVLLPPDAEEKKRCARIVAQRMQANAFIPDEDYNQISGLLNVIHSSIIGPDKSSGYPYCEQGLPKNAQVLERYGEKGFAQHVLNEWKGAYQFKLFVKGDPTPKKKIDQGRPRIITGMPLHATVKHASVLKNFAFSCVKNWKKSPIKYAFSPANPGHLEHLKEVLPGRVRESDKHTWDFTFHKYIADICSEIICLLAVRPPSWTDEQLEQYKEDVRLCFAQVFDKSVYRTSDGTIFEMVSDGIMKSGWFGTIAVNSTAQLVVDTLALIRLGYADEDIIEMPIVAGGDDVNQELKDVDLEAYTKACKVLGVDTDIHDRENLEASEYFSNDIRLGKDGFEFHPKRWTKHIEHIKTVKTEDLAAALCSHMENYRHNATKFRLLENMYHEMRNIHPGLFPVASLKSRDYLLAKQYGYEHALE